MDGTEASSEEHHHSNEHKSHNTTLTLLREIRTYLTRVQHSIDNVDEDHCFQAYWDNLRTRSSTLGLGLVTNRDWYEIEIQVDYFIRLSGAQIIYRELKRHMLLEMVRDYGEELLEEAGYSRILSGLRKIGMDIEDLRAKLEDVGGHAHSSDRVEDNI